MRFSNRPIHALFKSPPAIKDISIKLSFEDQLLPYIISSGKDYNFLNSIIDLNRREAIAKQVIVNLNTLSYNRSEAVNCYLSADFSNIDDSDSRLLNTLVTPAWYDSNVDNLDSFVSRSAPGLNRDRFFAQLARHSIIAGDGRADGFLGQIKNQKLRNEVFRTDSK